MSIRPQYTAKVSHQYKQETQHRKVRYSVEENLLAYPDILNVFLEWRLKQSVRSIATFESVMHEDYQFPLFDIRTAEIREDWGQRNPLLESGRQAKILGMAKTFNIKLIEPISVDYIVDEDAFIIRDGGGRAHAAFMNGIYKIPAIVRIISSAEESRELFVTQDKNAASISGYDKFLQYLADPTSNYHNKSCDTFAISRSSGICLHHSQKSKSNPLVEGIGTLQRIINSCGGDQKGTKWGKKSAPNLVKSIDILKNCFPNNDEFPVSVLYALTAFVEVSKHRIPSGEKGLNRLIDFVNLVKASSAELEDINNWVRVLKFDSSNHYDTYGASALMKKWNEVFKNANKGRKPADFYSFVKWDDWEIESASNKIFSFARDPSLYS